MPSSSSPSLQTLPPELQLSILAYLPLPTLTRIPILCSAFSDLFLSNETVIYRSAAFLHKYIDHSGDVQLEEVADSLGEKMMKGVCSWRDLCRRLHLADLAWEGKRPSGNTKYPACGTSVLRLKVDEKRGFVACTSEHGGLVVTDLNEPSRALWSLSSNHVRPYAHIEYENSFLAFDRTGNIKEIWRHIPDIESSPPHQVITSAQPDESQLQAEFWPSHPSTDDGSARGHFRPHCLLRPPANYTGRLSAYHLVYPYLFSSGMYRAFIWDIRTGEVVQEFELTQMLEDDNHLLFQSPLSYVEFSDTHVFVARMNGLQILKRSRERGEEDEEEEEDAEDGSLVAQFLSQKMCYGSRYYALTPPSFSSAETVGQDQGGLIKQQIHVERFPLDTEGRRFLFDCVRAVHVTPSGDHLFILLGKPHLIIIPWWKEALNLTSDEVEPLQVVDCRDESDTVIIENVQLLGHRAHTVRLGGIGGFSRYLAVDEDQDGKARVGVATTSGIFVLTMNPPPKPEFLPPEGVDLELNVSLATGALLSRPGSGALKRVSCLQLSPTGLWVTHPSRPPPEDDQEVEGQRRRSIAAYWESLGEGHEYEPLLAVHHLMTDPQLWRADEEDDEEEDWDGDGDDLGRSTVWSIDF